MANTFKGLKCPKCGKKGLHYAAHPHELLDNQIELTADEFRMLRAFHGNMKALHKAIHDLEKKLKTHG